MTKELTQEVLQELLQYDSDTGVFTWRERDVKYFAVETNCKRWNTRYSGKVAGTADARGYISIKLFKKIYLSHRLTFLYMTGEFPIEQVDHINQVKGDNRFCNLREVTHHENGKNQSMHKNNTSGTVGVSWHKSANKWVARIKVDGKVIHLGLFTDKQDAITARELANIKYDFHINHGNST